MNEQIKELAEQARLLTGWPVGEIEYQKFAELIVAECISTLDQDDGATHHGELLREHFGVKE